ncbi:hypothetical protein FOZ60_016773 [Perkinsus olseni]|uniref:CCHC-type domain-containing protein n=1 Tax=Perkinsus olseni TaxID=32597 RepID=A0A7J6N4B3_PEROL|nr:hypothetical protein FOZ60_016773 [Perkinsus olseni]
MLNAPEKVDGYAHDDLKTVDTVVDAMEEAPSVQEGKSSKRGKKPKKATKGVVANEAATGSSGGPVGSGSCRRCNSNGHTAENCTSENLSIFRGRCYTCADTSHQANKCTKDKSKLVCKRCLLGGHVADVCRVKWSFIPKSHHPDPSSSGVSQPPQPSGKFETTINQKKEATDVSANSNLCETGDTQMEKAEIGEIYECQTKAVSWLDLRKGMIYAKFKVFCGNPYETVDMCGLLDTGANLSIIDNHTVEEMVRKRAGRVAKLPQPLTCTMADGSRQVLTHAWHCMVQQLTKPVDGVGQYVQSGREARFIILKTIKKDKVLIGRDQFEDFGFVIGKMINCHHEKGCLLTDPSQVNKVMIEDLHRVVIHCDHAESQMTDAADEINATKVYESKTYEDDLCVLTSEWLALVKKAVLGTEVPRKIDCKKLLVYIDASQSTWGGGYQNPKWD